MARLDIPPGTAHTAWEYKVYSRALNNVEFQNHLIVEQRNNTLPSLRNQ